METYVDHHMSSDLLVYHLSKCVAEDYLGTIRSTCPTHWCWFSFVLYSKLVNFRICLQYTVKQVLFIVDRSGGEASY